jgi:hypothetical protein
VVKVVWREKSDHRFLGKQEKIRVALFVRAWRLGEVGFSFGKFKRLGFPTKQQKRDKTH